MKRKQPYTGLPALPFALLILLAAFLSVYYDRGPASVYTSRLEELAEEEQGKMMSTYAYLDHDDAMPAFYTPAEADHLRDVRFLLDITRWLFSILILVLLSLAWKMREHLTTFYGALRWGGFGTLVVTALLVLSMLAGFDAFWTTFHKVLFPQGNWLFPPDSALITLFPLEFFLQLSAEILLATITFALLSVGITLLLEKRSPRPSARR